VLIQFFSYNALESPRELASSPYEGWLAAAVLIFVLLMLHEISTVES